MTTSIDIAKPEKHHLILACVPDPRAGVFLEVHCQTCRVRLGRWRRGVTTNEANMQRQWVENIEASHCEPNEGTYRI